MVILHYRSPYLQRILSTNKKENDGTLVHIKLPNISPEIFQIILRYIYDGKLSLKDYDSLEIIKILVASNELGLQELITYLQFYLIENEKNWMEQNFNLIYQTSFGNDSLLELQKYCTDLITKEPNKIFTSINFSSIPEKLLISIIQNDNLQISEVQIWDHVLKWGLAQNPELPSDPTKYSKDDFKNLRNTLQRFIPFIKFNNLTSKEFIDKVLPYEKIFPKDLYKNLLRAFLSLLDPNSKPSNEPEHSIPKESEKTIDSKIITHQHVELISKWVDRLEITDKLISSYEFKLLFRASRDGHSKEKFHEICDNKPRTISIAKVKGSSEIIGGYNPLKWDNSYYDYSITKDSFIFSFDNDRIDNYILSRVIDKDYAIYNDSNYGPSFGEGDLELWEGNENINYCVKCDYEKHIRKTEDNFAIDECEVFQIICD
ncbi:carbohydrate-binding module family 13 protein [Rhizophagus clarus]|nr:carbohydrate-binding module family 13 protein [Rhizophagus clarus]